MKRLHVGALVCFALALLFYVISWVPALWAIVVLGVLFEAAAWLLVWFGPDEPYYGPPPRR